jgi:pilus assembly protein TadC
VSAKGNTASGGIGLGGALFITFFVLKLVGVIDWSWWWVTAPLWGGVAFLVGLFVLVGIGALIVSFVSSAAEKRRIKRNLRRALK